MILASKHQLPDVKVSFDGGATVEVMVAGGPNSRESEVIMITITIIIIIIIAGTTG